MRLPGFTELGSLIKQDRSILEVNCEGSSPSINTTGSLKSLLGEILRREKMNW